MSKLIYLNNFPRENATAGQEFKGTPELEKELKKRKIIGTGVPVSSDSEEMETLKAELISKDEEMETLKAELISKDEEIETLKLLVEEAISLPKGTEPKGFEKYKG